MMDFFSWLGLGAVAVFGLYIVLWWTEGRVAHWQQQEEDEEKNGNGN